ncbi:hypothetical protein ICW40_15515 [Actinotalea ferrariae]|uniref:hypothetical protein n=1 Tax=Actinotalea ferrariae TaxID=1386098 RepID=UPI001C8C0467|nr:hypothetical protein [Actinotalea ferrariae]MBX9246206.1 hypothetical protein [Actinotalea ferrariae]
MLRRTLSVPGGLIAVRDSRSESFPDLGRGDRVKASRSVVLLAVALEEQAPVALTLTATAAGVIDDPTFVALWSGRLRVPSRTLTVETVTGAVAQITDAPDVQLTVLAPHDALTDEDRLREVIVLVVPAKAGHVGQLEWSAAEPPGEGQAATGSDLPDLAVLPPRGPTEIAAVRGRWPWGLAYIYDADASPEEWPAVDDGSAAVWAARRAIAVRVTHEQDGEVLVRLHLNTDEPFQGSVCIHDDRLAISAAEIRVGDAAQAVSVSAPLAPGLYAVRVLVDDAAGPQRVEVLLRTTDE